MSQDKKLEEQFSDYMQIAKENKNVDIASLMINALQKQDQDLVSARQKKWAYLVSAGLPPLGLLFALKFYFSDESDAHSVANICVLLTVLSVATFFVLGKMILSGSGTSLNQIQQITPQDTQQLSQ